MRKTHSQWLGEMTDLGGGFYELPDSNSHGGQVTVDLKVIEVREGKMIFEKEA